MANAITAYSPLMDGSETLTDDPKDDRFGAGSTRFSLTWNPSNDIIQTSNTGELTSRPLLCYRVDPSGNAQNIRLEIRINNNDIGSDATFSGTISRTYVEIVNQTVSKGDNTILFSVDGGEGNLRISDVVVFYKRLVESVG